MKFVTLSSATYLHIYWFGGIETIGICLCCLCCMIFLQIQSDVHAVQAQTEYTTLTICSKKKISPLCENLCHATVMDGEYS